MSSLQISEKWNYSMVMPYRILCNGTEQKSLEARSGLTLKPSHFSPLHKIRYGVLYSFSKSKR